jgi:nifR3 family TIM-barrel protein
MSIDLISALKSNPFALAPMAGITDPCFRTFMRELGCGIVVSELVSSHGIEYKSTRTLALMGYEEIQRPVGIQLFGDDAEILGRAAKVVEEHGADFVDLNFGCPVPKVVKKGGGSAVLKDLAQVERIFRAVKAATSLPVTVKIRTGWDESTRNAEKVSELAFNEGLTWVAIHGRTRAAGYSGQADWDYISTVKAKSKIPIIGNGDIHSADQAVARLKESACDGVMIGRGCLKNPWIFRESLELWQNVSACNARNTDISNDFVVLFNKMRTAFEVRVDQKITMLQIKKFASWYSSGYPGASAFRKAIFQTQSLDDTMSLTLDFFGALNSIVPVDTSDEGFLMGGHG